jgi:hypothetical protein
VDDGGGTLSGPSNQAHIDAPQAVAFQKEQEIMSFEHLDDSQLSMLVEDLEDLVHDLGKYIVFETRMVAEGASDAVLMSALRTDLYETRKHTDANGVVVTEAAWSVWERLRPSALGAADEVVQIDSLMSELQGVDLKEVSPMLNKVRTQTYEVRTLLKALLGRVRKEEEER